MNDENALVVKTDDGIEPVVIPSGTLTPATARVDSIHQCLSAAMSRASLLTITPEEAEKLKADFPDAAFKTGAAGKENLIYIEHAYLRDRFDEALGMGQWALVRTRPQWTEQLSNSVRVYCECALIVRGVYISENIGDSTYFPNNPIMTYSDAAEAAQTQAFRRCAKQFGVGLQAWKKDWCAEWLARNKEKQATAQPQVQTRPQPQQAITPTKTRFQELATGINAAKTEAELTVQWNWAHNDRSNDRITKEEYTELIFLKRARLDEIRGIVKPMEPKGDSKPEQQPETVRQLFNPQEATDAEVH